MRLRHKFSIIIISLLIITIVLPGVIYYQFSKNVLEKQINNYLKAELTKYTYETEGWLQSHSQIISTIGDIIETSYYKENITADLLQSYINNKDISDIYIGFNDGTFLSGIGWIPPANYDPRSRSWYTEALASKDINISNIYSDMTTQKDAVSIGKNLKDKSGKIIGVIAEDLLVETIYKKINNIKLDNEGYAFLMDKTGKILVTPDYSLINHNFRELIENSSQSEIQTTSENFKTYIYRNQRKLIAFKDIKGANLRLALVIPEKTAYKPLSSLLTIYLYIALISILLASIISFVLDGNIVNRLRILSNVSNELRAGNFDVEMQELGKDEIGEVSQAFKRMQSQLKKSFSELDWIAYHDLLTNLPNRLKLIEDMKILINDCENTEKQFAVVFVDLDDFKNVNDILGYAAGDLLLIKVGEVLNKKYRAYRIGADEFAVIISSFKTPEELHQKVEAVSTLLSHNFELKYNSIYNSATIGISVYPKDFQELREMMTCTDAALNKAKATSPGSIKYYEASILEELDKRIELESGLRNALEKKEFILNYQPIVDKNQRIKGFEALIRWKREDGKIISPMEFIPVLENMAIIHDVGLWIIREAVTSLNKFKEYYKTDLTMAINLSANQIKQQSFCENVIELMKEVNADPKYIEFEITETVIIESIEIVRDQLKLLSDFGIRISLDDFGTGYSSLNYLQHFPINILKIDKSFIDYLKNDTVDKSLIKHIIEIAHWFNMETIAEGVETDFQNDYLIENKCDYIQGYLYFKPMNETDVLTYLNGLKNKE